jgi:hypothetical protein
MESRVTSLSPEWQHVAQAWAALHGIPSHPACTRVCGAHRNQFGLAFQTNPTGKLVRTPSEAAFKHACCLRETPSCTRKGDTFYFLMDIMRRLIAGSTPGALLLSDLAKQTHQYSLTVVTFSLLFR